MMRLARLALLSIPLVAWSVVAQDPPKPDKPSEVPTASEKVEVPAVVEGITARELGGHMKFLASDLMRGRDTASPEIRLAAEYLASRLSAAGAEPSGDLENGRKTYFQRFPLEVVTPTLEGTKFSIEVQTAGSRREIPLQIGVDVFFSPQPGLTAGEVDAEVVFAGHGRADDYGSLDVKNRFVLVLSGQPPAKPKEGDASSDPARPKAQAPGGNRPGRGNPNAGKLEAAAKLGALGLIVIQSPANLEVRRPTDGAGNPGRSSFGRPSMALGSATPSIPLLTLADPIRDLMFQAIGRNPSAVEPSNLGGVRARLVYSARKESKDDRNVIGVFPGSDPEKKKEVVVYSAHYDHVGVDEKGEIYNGSDDNASGTSALLEIAEAFGDGPRPARTVAFLWVSGEEKGLLGSQWFSDHPALPADSRIVADINIDMISRNDGRSIGMTPSQAHPSHTSLVTLAEGSAKVEGMEIKYDADQYFGRTDSANFARKGIPVVFFFSGLHEDYHKATDEVEKADFDKAARVARAAYRLGWQVAQSPELPKKTKSD